MIRTGAPTAVLQGMRDEDVPFSHALALMQRLRGDPATLTLIKDGDHRLSRPQDLQLMFEALERMVTSLLSTSRRKDASFRTPALHKGRRITPKSRRSDAGSRREP